MLRIERVLSVREMFLERLHHPRVPVRIHPKLLPVREDLDGCIRSEALVSNELIIHHLRFVLRAKHHGERNNPKVLEISGVGDNRGLVLDHDD